MSILSHGAERRAHSVKHIAFFYLSLILGRGLIPPLQNCALLSEVLLQRLGRSLLRVPYFAPRAMRYALSAASVFPPTLAGLPGDTGHFGKPPG